jgi:hypothetical protein
MSTKKLFVECAGINHFWRFPHSKGNQVAAVEDEKRLFANVENQLDYSDCLERQLHHLDTPARGKRLKGLRQRRKSWLKKIYV